ncbi:unnamed protein product [Mortierella alpina]
MFIRRSAAIVLMGLSVTLISLSSISAAPATVTGQDLKSLGEDFKELRQVKGFWNKKDYNEDVDAPKGKKHLVMKDLHDALSKPGTEASLVQETMGPSDTIPDAILRQLKASEPKTATPTHYTYLMYQWRGNHDFLWFRIDLDTNLVVNSKWYLAYE